MTDDTRAKTPSPADPAHPPADRHPRDREIAPTEPDPAEGANDTPAPRPGSPKG